MDGEAVQHGHHQVVTQPDEAGQGGGGEAGGAVGHTYTDGRSHRSKVQSEQGAGGGGGTCQVSLQQYALGFTCTLRLTTRP